MKVLYSGGGTLGAVSPLFAIHAEFQSRADYQGLWVGRKGQREQALALERGLKIFSVVEARARHAESDGWFSLTTLVFPFYFLGAFLKALAIIVWQQPQVHITCGSFVSVPVALAAWFCRVPTIVHQQDLIPGLANRLMAKMARKVTVAFPELGPKFGIKAIVTGNPARPEVLLGDKAQALERFGLKEKIPTIFVVGGSTGAVGVNNLIEKALPELTAHFQVLHMTGASMIPRVEHRYRAVQFMNQEISDAYALADVVVARAGLSTMTEIGALRKPAVLIPIPGSHQIKNAEFFSSKGAALTFSEDGDPHEFAAMLIGLAGDSIQLQKLGERARDLFPTDAAKRIVEVVEKVAAK
ncbi:MAG: UDP-N-acetylglucosamine--N-acetylmuramyl-(pentapeptide) pyrophosphoryl-undecaprenol N-acetylglucosamine transferase [bacterium]